MREVLEFCPRCGWGEDMLGWRNNGYQCRSCGLHNLDLKRDDEQDEGNVVGYDDADLIDPEGGESGE